MTPPDIAAIRELVAYLRRSATFIGPELDAIEYLLAEREALTAELAEAKRALEREVMASATWDRSLDEARAELPKWYASGRGIFRRDAGVQVACMPIVPNWQEDTEMVVALLNAGEEVPALRARCARLEEALREIVVWEGRYGHHNARAALAESEKTALRDAVDWHLEPDEVKP